MTSPKPPGPPASAERHLLRTVLDAANDAFVATDRVGNITEWNPKAEAMFGWSRAEALGLNLSSTIIPPWHVPAHDAGMARLTRTGESRVLGRILELEAQRRDGSVFPVELTLWAPDVGPFVYCGFIRDITERRRARDAIELTRATASAVNAAVDADEALRAVLAAICRFTGWPLGQAWRVVGERVVPSGVWHREAAEGFEHLIAASREVQLHRGEGLPGRVLASGSPAWIPDVHLDPNFPRRLAPGLEARAGFGLPVRVGHEVVAVLEFFQEEAAQPDEALLGLLDQVGTQLGRAIDRERAEAERLRALELERSNRDLQMFAFVASHDLREPLRMIVSYLQLLERHLGDGLDPAGRGYLDRAVHGSRRLHTLIESLLTLSRIDAAPPASAPSSARRAFEQALENVEAVAREGGAVVTADDLPTVCVDAAQLTQLFQNLLSNAIRYAGDAPPRVHVSAKSSGGQWLFRVTDNGRGIPEGDRERVFEVFRRGDRQGGPTGTGIGLAVCRRIVERHGGRIWVEPNPTGGSVFAFLLPALPC